MSILVWLRKNEKLESKQMLSLYLLNELNINYFLQESRCYKVFYVLCSSFGNFFVLKCYTIWLMMATYKTFYKGHNIIPILSLPQRENRRKPCVN